MATLYWVGGSGSKSWADTANWSTSAGGAGGSGPPGSADVVNIGKTASDSAIDTSLTWSTGGGTLNVYPGFTGTIGTSGGTALDMNGSALNYYGKASLANFADVGNVLVNTPSTGAVTISGTDLDTKTVTVVSGNVFFDASAVNLGKTGTVEFHGGSITMAAEASGDPVAFSAWGGASIACARTVGTVSITGTSTLLRTTGTKTATRVNVAEYATYLINSTGTITNLYARPRGRVSMAGIPGSVTITNIYTYPGAKVLDQTGGILTVTNPVTDYETVP